LGTEGSAVGVARLDRWQLKSYRREIRMIFHHPYSSLNPRMPVLEIVGELLKVNRGATG